MSDDEQKHTRKTSMPFERNVRRRKTLKADFPAASDVIDISDDSDDGDDGDYSDDGEDGDAGDADADAAASIHEQFLRLRELDRRQLIEKTICPNGHCLFLAICDQLKSRSLNPRDYDFTPVNVMYERKRYSNHFVHAAQQLRSDVADYMLDNRAECNITMDSKGTRYVEQIRNTNKWGSAPELKAAASVLNVAIVCIGYGFQPPDSTTLPVETFRPETGFPAATLYICYVNHSHFQSTTQYDVAVQQTLATGVHHIKQSFHALPHPSKKMIQQICRNIIDKPDKKRYRALKIQDSKYDPLTQHSGALAFMTNILGFTNALERKTNMARLWVDKTVASNRCNVFQHVVREDI
jgi:hypothetical protein